MKKLRRRITDRLLTYAFCLFIVLTRILPLSWSRKFGKLMAKCAYYALPRVRKTGLENIDAAYGDSLTRTQKIAILKGSFENFGIVVAEFSRTPEFSTPKGRQRVRIEGVEKVDVDRGGVLVGGHLGSWEWMAPAAAAYGYRIAEVVNKSRDPKQSQVLDSIRGRANVMIIPEDRARREVPRALRNGMFVGILADQSPRASGIPVTVFGRPCWATAAPAFFAIRTGAPVYVVKMRREPDYSYVLEVHGPVDWQSSGDIRRDVSALTQRLQDNLEERIRENPEQWLWMQKRWTTRKRLTRKWERYRERESSETPPAGGSNEGQASGSDPQPTTSTHGATR